MTTEAADSRVKCSQCPAMYVVGEDRSTPTRCPTCAEKNRQSSAAWARADPERARRKRKRIYDADRAGAVRETERWRQANPDRAKANQMLHAARRHGVDTEYVLPSLVYAEHGYVCHLCEEAIDPGLVWPDRRSKSLDHVIPMQLGGAHTYRNVRPAHIGCNQKKAASAIPEQLRQLIIQWQRDQLV